MFLSEITIQTLGKTSFDSPSKALHVCYASGDAISFITKCVKESENRKSVLALEHRNIRKYGGAELNGFLTIVLNGVDCIRN
jgi:hypothetical protein